MAAHPDDVNAVDDLTLVSGARAGDRLAFGVLYLRHHAAAWRVACVASRFSPDAELAVIEGFTRVFSALPAENEVLEAGGVTFRPYLLACVRQAALDRASAAGRGEAADHAVLLAGLGPDGEVVLSSLEHHVARGALAALPERSRTALWLSDVEAMTPGEVAGILGGEPEEMPGLTAGARAEIHTVQQAALGRQEVRAGCRFTVDHLDAYQAGTLDPTEGLIVRSHLTECPPCRMRQGELSIAPAALAGAVPAAPLLGGEAQHHWLAAVADARPATRLLPPVLAAGGAVPREPLGRRTATRLGTAAGAAMTPARGLPGALRRVGRAAAGSWRSDGDSIDLTTRRGPAPDPTGPPAWTGTPGSSGGLAPPLPPDWTVPPVAPPGPLPIGGRPARPAAHPGSHGSAGPGASSGPVVPPGLDAGGVVGPGDDGSAAADDAGDGAGPGRSRPAGGAGLHTRLPRCGRSDRFGFGDQEQATGRRDRVRLGRRTVSGRLSRRQLRPELGRISRRPPRRTRRRTGHRWRVPTERLSIRPPAGRPPSPAGSFRPHPRSPWRRAPLPSRR